jgi:hypothetical protein
MLGDELGKCIRKDDNGRFVSLSMSRVSLRFSCETGPNEANIVVVSVTVIDKMTIGHERATVAIQSLMMAGDTRETKMIHQRERHM